MHLIDLLILSTKFEPIIANSASARSPLMLQCCTIEKLNQVLLYYIIYTTLSAPVSPSLIKLLLLLPLLLLLLPLMILPYRLLLPPAAELGQGD